ncbi:MmpS family transport accessory protein [Mycobacterium avium]|uniref:MmpS family transport accessory protein n=1 Tax=Mycobacterium avium TaxID=1764 RepID=UPI0009C12F68|nr:MmpS family transport accessory protein [Mycobacterium avium]
MMRIQLTIASLIAGVSALELAPAARADDTVTYEVFSDSVGVANIEYLDHSGRKALENVPLPWRTDATVVSARSTSIDDGAEVRADWRPNRAIAGTPNGFANHWVTVRVSFQGKVICENTLDVGDAACYGSTNFRS